MSAAATRRHAISFTHRSNCRRCEARANSFDGAARDDVMKTSTTGTYIYCLVKSGRRPALARAPRGVPGAGAPRLLQGPAGVWIAVADVPLALYSATAINAHLKDLDWVSERALAHEAVVELFARSHDVVPIKLFTIFRDDERARSHVGSARALAGVFRRIAGCSEWSVRLSCPPAAGAETADRPAVASGRGEVPLGTRGRFPGTSFLQRKKTQRDEIRKAGTAARTAVEQVYRRLDAVAKDSVRKPSDLPGSHLILDAAFLVARRKQAAFEREVERLATTASKAGCELVLSGPWPAYHFVGGA